MTNLKSKIIASVAIFALIIGATVWTPTAKAAVFGDGDSNSNLGDLFILSELFGDGNGMFGNGDRNLGDLFILNELFGDGGDGMFNGGDGNNLGDLIILDELFGNSNGLFDSNGNRNLGDLFILNELFGDGGDGIFGGSGNNLGDLIILDELFSDGVLDGEQKVTVKSGDTLSAIALATLGDAGRYPEIAAANNIANPNLIYPGQVLTIPSDNGEGRNLGDLIILDKLFN
jgi:hypothetical protein